MEKRKELNKETFYFSHDYNTRSDIKVKKLIGKHGYLGYGLFWALIEDLYQNDNKMPLDYDLLAFDLRTSSNIVKSIINNFELFKIDGDFFSSLSVQRRLDMRNEKSLKARQSAKKRWETDANAMRTHSKKDANASNSACDRNAIKETKGKDSKGNENKENIHTHTNIPSQTDLSSSAGTSQEDVCVFDFKKALLDYGFERGLVEEWMVIRAKRNLVNSTFAFNTFISQIRKAGGEKNELLRIIAEKQWGRFNHTWLIDINNKNLNYTNNEAIRRDSEKDQRRKEFFEYAKSHGMA